MEKFMNRADILDEAKKCVCGQRQEDYGEIEDNFSCIAQLWTAFKGVEFDARDVAIMMALLKTARMRKPGHLDSAIDAAGYFACAGQLESEMINEKATEDGNNITYHKVNTTWVQYIDESGNIKVKKEHSGR